MLASRYFRRLGQPRSSEVNCMDSHPENPSTNQLPKSFSEEEVTATIKHSGYPLQTAVALDLTAAGFNIVEEWGYVDRTTREHRTLDIRGFSSPSVSTTLALSHLRSPNASVSSFETGKAANALIQRNSSERL